MPEKTKRKKEQVLKEGAIFLGASFFPEGADQRKILERASYFIFPVLTGMMIHP